MSSAHARRRALGMMSSSRAFARAFDVARGARAATTTVATIAPIGRIGTSRANALARATTSARYDHRGNVLRGIGARGAASASTVPPKPTPNREMRDDFLNAASAQYLEAMEDEYRKDPTSVHESWAALLRQLDSGLTGAQVSEMHDAMASGTAPVAVGRPLDMQTIQESMRLTMLIRAYQISGHSIANLDPLALEERDMPISLDPSLYGFS